MYFVYHFAVTAGLFLVNGLALPSRTTPKRSNDVITPKVMIVSMFDPEANVWYGIDEFDILAQNVSLPGLSPLFPEVHCTSNGEVCQITIGEGGMSSLNDESTAQLTGCARNQCSDQRTKPRTRSKF